jgi:hypothetical protein
MTTVSVKTHPAALPVERLLADCDIRRTRRSGPGGQHRNKVETAVILLHRPTQISAEASERRSQEENRQEAVFRLRLRLAVEVRHLVSEPYRPSELWISRCQGGKVAVNARHDDFPAVLAEVLDVVVSFEHDVRLAAASLACTPSQLTKLLQQEPRAMLIVNQAREQLGLHKLK